MTREKDSIKPTTRISYAGKTKVWVSSTVIAELKKKEKSNLQVARRKDFHDKHAKIFHNVL